MWSQAERVIWRMRVAYWISKDTRTKAATRGRAHARTHTQARTHTHKYVKTYCCTSTAVSWMRLSVTLYMHRHFCFLHKQVHGPTGNVSLAGHCVRFYLHFKILKQSCSKAARSHTATKSALPPKKRCQRENWVDTV